MAGEADPHGAESSTDGATARVEVYETDSGVVLYDAANPLAWIESRTSILIDDAA